MLFLSKLVVIFFIQISGRSIYPQLKAVLYDYVCSYFTSYLLKVSDRTSLIKLFSKFSICIYSVSTNHYCNALGLYNQAPVLLLSLLHKCQPKWNSHLDCLKDLPWERQLQSVLKKIKPALIEQLSFQESAADLIGFCCFSDRIMYFQGVAKKGLEACTSSQRSCSPVPQRNDKIEGNCSNFELLISVRKNTASLPYSLPIQC